MRRVKKACVSSSAIPSWWSTQPSRVRLRLKVSGPMAGESNATTASARHRRVRELEVHARAGPNSRHETRREMAGPRLLPSRDRFSRSEPSGFPGTSPVTDSNTTVARNGSMKVDVVRLQPQPAPHRHVHVVADPLFYSGGHSIILHSGPVDRR